jgi:cardiolipin synthase A/B
VSAYPLPAAIEVVARHLTASQAAILAGAVAVHESPTSEARAQALGAIAHPAYRDIAGQLMDAWEVDGTMSGSGLALAITSTATAIARERAEQSIEIVWTGPRTTAVPVRLTREVLVDVIRAARSGLFIVSFAAYKVDVIVRELSAAASRGVDIKLILETLGGTLYVDAASAFETLRDSARFYVWPLGKRPALVRGRAQLHAKAAIADDHTAFVTSANLTGHGIAENMELGLLVRGGGIPRRLSAHFKELIAEGTLDRILR